MRIAIASDHAGYELKEHVKAQLAAAGHDVVDVGPDSDESVDYPRYAAPAARLVAEGDAERGVLVCGSGVGVAIVEVFLSEAFEGGRHSRRVAAIEPLP